MYSPIHYSHDNLLHRDAQMDGCKIGHQPMSPGQTTLPTYNIGGSSSYANDRQMFQINNPGTNPPLLPY